MQKKQLRRNPRSAPLAIVLLLTPMHADDVPHRFPGFERSLSHVEAALNKYPGSARILQVQARVYFRNGRFEEAVRLFEAALQKDSQAAELYLGLAASHSRLGQSEQTIAVHERALTLGDRRLEVRARKGIANELHKLGRYADELRELQKVSPQARNPQVNFELGRALELVARAEKGQQAAALQTEALKAYDQALNRAPGHAKALYARGRLRLQRGDRAGGRKDLENFQRVHTPAEAAKTENMIRSGAEFEARTLVELAGALAAISDGQTALELLELARNLGVLRVDVENGRGSLLRRAGQLVEAATAYRAVLEIEPKHPEALWNLGRISLDGGHADKAAPFLLAALNSNPDFVEGWEFLATVSADGVILSDRAEELAGHALKLRPSPENFARLARAFSQQGKIDKCQEVISQGLQRYPGHPQLKAAQREFCGAGQ